MSCAGRRLGEGRGKVVAMPESSEPAGRVPAADAQEPKTPGAADQSAGDLEQTHADFDQTLADADQTASESDQQASDGDQTQSDRDQRSSDRDQAAADRQLGDSSSPEIIAEEERSRHEREESARERLRATATRAATADFRLRTASERDDIAVLRDRNAAARDRAARARDDAAQRRDRNAEERERRALEAGSLDEATHLALKTMREAADLARRTAAAQRLSARADRDDAARDRTDAAKDRERTALDLLTSALRSGGATSVMSDDHERTPGTGSQILVMIDVGARDAAMDGADRDELVSDLAAAIASAMRVNDLVVRWYGEEFLCAIADTTLEAATERVAEMRSAFAARRPGASLLAGLAEVNDHDSYGSLIARADTALRRAKEAADCQPDGTI